MPPFVPSFVTPCYLLCPLLCLSCLLLCAPMSPSVYLCSLMSQAMFPMYPPKCPLSSPVSPIFPHVLTISLCSQYASNPMCPSISLCIPSCITHMFSLPPHIPEYPLNPLHVPFPPFYVPLYLATVNHTLIILAVFT